MKVIGNSASHNYVVGQIYRVVKWSGSGVSVNVILAETSNSAKMGNYAHVQDLELASRKDLAEDMRERSERMMAEASELAREAHNYACFETEEDEQIHHIFEAFNRGSLKEVRELLDKYAPATEERQYAVGDCVLVVKNVEGHNYKVGEQHTVCHVANRNQYILLNPKTGAPGDTYIYGHEIATPDRKSRIAFSKALVRRLRETIDSTLGHIRDLSRFETDEAEEEFLIGEIIKHSDSREHAKELLVTWKSKRAAGLSA